MSKLIKKYNMKNLLNCHCIGLNSFPVSLNSDGFYRRIFCTDKYHELWKPVILAIHPHHVDIKMTILDGELFNPIYEISDRGEVFKKFLWNSHILNGSGGFEYIGEQSIRQVSNIKHKAGDIIKMRACDLHTVQVEKNKTCTWLIEESKPCCDYFPINYSKRDLQNWKTEGLYIECDDQLRDKYIGEFYYSLSQGL